MLIEYIDSILIVWLALGISMCSSNFVKGLRYLLIFFCKKEIVTVLLFIISNNVMIKVNDKIQ